MRKKKHIDNDNRDEMLACYAQGLLSAAEREAVKDLIKNDPRLKEELTVQEAICQTEDESLAEIPDDVISKAKNLVSEPFGVHIWNVAVRFSRQTLRALKSDGSPVDCVVRDPVLSRGSKTELTKSTVIRKGFGVFDIQMEISVKKKSVCCIVIFIKDLKKQSPMNDVRITLIKDNIELESYVTSQGRAVFEDIRDGYCLLEITAPDKPVARITLQLIPE